MIVLDTRDEQVLGRIAGQPGRRYFHHRASDHHTSTIDLSDIRIFEQAGRDGCQSISISMAKPELEGQLDGCPPKLPT